MILQAITATSNQYIEVLLITIGMLLVSRLFNKIFKIDRTSQMELQQKIQSLQQEAMSVMQSDPIEAQRIQKELMEMMNDMMKKTLVPSCIRLLVFLGFFAVFNAIYSGVDFFTFNILIFGRGAVALYFLYSIGLSLLSVLIKKLIKKMKGETEEQKVEDIANAFKSPLRGQFGVNPMGTMNPMMTNPSLNRRQIKEIPEDLQPLKKSLEEKQKRGELPKDIDIDEEMQNLIEEDDAINEKKSWKKKLSESNDSE